MEKAINLLGKIIENYDSNNLKKMNQCNELFNLILIDMYEDQCSPERCEIDNIRQTFVMSSTGFPVEDSAIKQARYKYEMMNAYLNC